MFKWRKHTPKPQTQLVIDHELCLSCGACVAACPPDSLFLQDDLALTVNQDTCTSCERCVRLCPVEALSLQPVSL